MRSVQSIAQQHHVLVMPALVLHQWKIQPADKVVRQKSASGQVLFEHLSEVRTGLRIRFPVKAGVSPGRFAAFNDEGAGRVVKLVSMGNEQAGFVLTKDQRQAVK